MNTYPECVDYLYSLISYETKPNWSYDNKSLNLDRFKEFLVRLGNPQDDLPIIHAAGSDGKGSTCAMLSSILQTAGYKTGLFTSPHLHSVRERIQRNRVFIPKDRFIYWTNYLKIKLEEHAPDQTGFTTFFELMTAMAFLYFREERVDFAVMETGLGGRLDATNVGNPLLCVITHISMEHADKLGNTLEKIADEKLGILRNHAPVIIGHQDQELIPHFHHRLDSSSSCPVFVDETYSVIESTIHENKRKIVFQQSEPISKTLYGSLLGQYQTQNMLTTYTAIQNLAQHHHISSLTDDEITTGLLHTQWDGRFEVIPFTSSKIVFDIAHTTKGAASLKLSLDEVFPQKKRLFILGFLNDKNAVEIINTLCTPEDHIYLTEPPTPRKLELHTLQQKCSPFENTLNIKYEKDALACFHTAKDQLHEQTILIVSGSLYLVSEIRKELLPTIEE